MADSILVTQGDDEYGAKPAECNLRLLRTSMTFWRALMSKPSPLKPPGPAMSVCYVL